MKHFTADTAVTTIQCRKNRGLLDMIHIIPWCTEGFETARMEERRSKSDALFFTSCRLDICIGNNQFYEF